MEEEVFQSVCVIFYLVLSLSRKEYQSLFRSDNTMSRPDSPTVTNCHAPRSCTRQERSDRLWAVYKSMDPFCQLLVFPPNSPVHGYHVGRQGAGRSRSADRASEKAHARTAEPREQRLYHQPSRYVQRLPRIRCVDRRVRDRPDGGERLRRRCLRATAITFARSELAGFIWYGR
jgi:hypothetical protein